MPSFIHLRVHTAYSLAEGAIRVKDLPKLCTNHKMPAVGVTDTANLFGALETAMACSGDGIQPIIGCQINLKTSKDLDPKPMVLLVKTEQGYKNLLKLVTQSYMEGEAGKKPAMTLEKLLQYRGGLIALTGGAPRAHRTASSEARARKSPGASWSTERDFSRPSLPRNHAPWT